MLHLNSEAFCFLIVELNVFVGTVNSVVLPCDWACCSPLVTIWQRRHSVPCYIHPHSTVWCYHCDNFTGRECLLSRPSLHSVGLNLVPTFCVKTTGNPYDLEELLALFYLCITLQFSCVCTYIFFF